MPRITTIEATAAQARLKARTAGYADRAPLRDAISRMSSERMLELEPDAGEPLRKLRLNMMRAAKEVGREIQQAESQTGTLLVWLAEPKKARPLGKLKALAAAD